MFFRAVFDITVSMPVEKILIRTNKERSTAAGRVKYFELACRAALSGGFSFEKFSHRVLHNIVHDVSRRIVNASGFLDFRFVLNNRAMIGYADDFSQELFVDLPEYIRREN